MYTSEQKYWNDISYHNFVDAIEAMLHKAEFTPSEVREMAVLACIHYERHRRGTVIKARVTKLDPLMEHEEIECPQHPGIATLGYECRTSSGDGKMLTYLNCYKCIEEQNAGNNKSIESKVDDNNQG